MPKPFLPLFLLFSISATLFAQPTITSFSPQSGHIGSSVTITGTNFSTVAANNIVYFGTSRAAVTSASATALSVTVPTGASYQPITVTTGNLTAYAAKGFDITFNGAGTSFATDTFSSPRTTGVMGGITNTLIGDLDADGKPDIVALGTGQPTLAVYKNATTAGGTVNFGSLYTLNLGTGNSTGALGDLDGDGLPDMVLNSGTGSSIDICKNTSTTSSISFAMPVEYPVSASAVTSPLSMAITDLDGNGKPDIITANADTSITVYRNVSTTAAFSFTDKQNYTVPSGSKTLTTADVNGDGKPDIILTSYSTGRIYIFKNTSTSGSISLTAAANYAAGSGTSGVAAGDLDGDGKTDLAVVNNTGKNLVLFRNTGSAGSISFSGDSTYSCGTYNPTGVAIGDIDGDGKPDLAVSTTDWGLLGMTQLYPVMAFKNVGSPGATSVAPGVAYPMSYSLYSMGLADMNIDGKLDFITADEAGRTFTVLHNLIKTDTTTPIAPHIGSFSPDSAASGTTVNVLGTHFTGATSVTFGNVAAQSFTVVSDSVIHAIVGTGATGYVKVITTAGSDSLLGFTYIAPAQPLSLTSFTPASGKTGDTILIHGRSLTGLSFVRFGGIPAQSFSILSDSLVIATVGTGATGQVLVSGSHGLDSLAGFTYIDSSVTPPAQPPHIFSFTPDSATTGATVSIFGAHFFGTTTVSFGSQTAQSFTIASDSVILAVVGSGSSGAVKVITSAGTDSLAGFIYYSLPSPPQILSITSFTPTSGKTGDTILVYGHALTGLGSVSFGGVPSPYFSVLSDSLVIAIVGTGASGQVLLNGLHGLDSLAGFTFLDSSSSLLVVPSSVPAELKGYPNPANTGNFSVVVPYSPVSSQFTLADMNGKVVRTLKVQPNTQLVNINTSGLNPGVYKLVWRDGVNYSYQTVLILK